MKGRISDKTSNLLDRLSIEYEDPQLVCHWSMINSPTCSTATVHITSSRGEFRHRTSFYIRMFTESYEIVCMDGTTVEIAGHSKDMEQFIAFQISCHLAQVSRSCLEGLGWSVPQFSKPFTCIQDSESLTVGLMATAPNTKSCVYINIDEKQNVRAIVERPFTNSKDQESLAKLVDKKWAYIECIKEEIDWKLLPGKNFLDKVSSLAALLS